MGIKERLLTYIDYKNVSKYRFYKLTGLANGFLDNKSSVQSNICEKILYVFPDLNPEWLMTGKGSMMRKNDENGIESTPIPLISHQAALSFNTSHNIDHNDVIAYYAVPDFHLPTFLIRLSNITHSDYRPGDIICCKVITSQAIRYNTIHLVISKSLGLLLQTVNKSTDKTKYLLSGDDPEKDSFEVPIKDCVIAQVQGIIRINI